MPRHRKAQPVTISAAREQARERKLLEEEMANSLRLHNFEAPTASRSEDPDSNDVFVPAKEDESSSAASESSDNSDALPYPVKDPSELEPRFFSITVAPQETIKYSLIGVSLSLTRAVLDFSDIADSCRLFAKTHWFPTGALILHLDATNASTAQAALDLDFFQQDREVTFFNDGTAPVTLVGSIGIDADVVRVMEEQGPKVSDEADEEDEEEEEEDEEGEEDDTDDKDADLFAEAFFDDDDDDEDEQGGDENDESDDVEEGEEKASKKSKKIKSAGSKRGREEVETTSTKKDDSSKKSKKAKLSKKEKELAKAAEQQLATSSRQKEREQKLLAQASEGLDSKKSKKSSSSQQLEAGFQRAKGGVRFLDSEVGIGRKPKRGRKVLVKYTGRLATNMKVFDSNDSFSFRLGVGECIRGFDYGVESMRVGGKRRLVIPPGAAYGPKGAPPAIPPNSTLIFDIELIKCF